MRIKLDDSVRKEFFELVKNGSGKLWNDLIREHGLVKGTFDRYKSGEQTIPYGLFSGLLKYLRRRERENILEKAVELPDNYGQVKGGKIAYSVNLEKFREGRKKGLSVIRKLRKIPIKYNFSDFRLTPGICEFVGAFIGDGFFNCYNNKLYHIEFAGDSRKDLDYYTKIIIPSIKTFIPKVRPKILKVKTRNSIRVIFYSKELFCFLKNVFDLVPGKKSYSVTIPMNIIESGEENIRKTIRGIFDTDGGVFLDRRKAYNSYYPRIIFSTVSKGLYEQLIDYLSKHFKLYTASRKAYGNRGQVYIIEIYGKEQLRKWMSLIGFSNRRHLDKVALVAQFRS
jgi:hypothetical protein